jgi:PhnB protein
MPTRLNPYLNFAGQAREAVDFYRSVFGGEASVSTFAEGGMPHDPADGQKIMHAQLETPSGFTLMISDTPASMGTPNPNGTISLSGDQDAELRGYWGKLAAGGSVSMPLEAAPWGDTFGMLVDKFGVSWMVNIAGRQ